MWIAWVDTSGKSVVWDTEDIAKIECDGKKIAALLWDGKQLTAAVFRTTAQAEAVHGKRGVYCSSGHRSVVES